MSRLDFRVGVDTPRPAAAWAMVTLAGATLWITQQLDPWAVAAQALALLVSLWRRTDPFSWQKSPLALNLGMIAIVVGTILVALRGEPSTIALAHFAATAQGLQLLDARPRRTEFLLVALALFQVVLAANLTDSVLFTPLLVGFLFATTWTLTVHTLRSEAIEAGVGPDVARAITPGLVRTTTLACLLALVLASVLFVLLPRLRSSVLNGPGRSAVSAAAGFSNRVELGTLGRIRQDPRVVLRVETLEGRAPARDQAYWRGLAFETFDGVSWSLNSPNRIPVPGSAEGGVELGRRPKQVNLVQRIVREPVEAGVLFAVGDPRGIQGTVRRLERDHSGGFYAAGQEDERIRYTVRSQQRTLGDAALRGDLAQVRFRGYLHYLQLPELSPAFHELAQRITARAESDAARARAIEGYLLSQGHYSDTPPTPDPESPLSPVEAFALGELAGHCEYFATAMVLLARINGLPSRLVNGFAGGRENSIGGFRELSRSDAHAWVEVHYERAGWIRYDPTPADLRLSAEAGLSLAMRLRELGSALELWWFQRVVGFDRADQVGALKRAWLAWRARGNHPSRSGIAADAKRRELAGPWREVVLLAFCALAALAAGILLWSRGRRRLDPLPASYRAGLRLLARRGLVREAATPARSFAHEAGTQLPPSAAHAFAALTEQYLATRFGDADDASGQPQLQALREALRRG